MVKRCEGIHVRWTTQMEECFYNVWIRAISSQAASFYPLLLLQNQMIFAFSHKSTNKTNSVPALFVLYGNRKALILSGFGILCAFS